MKSKEMLKKFRINLVKRLIELNEKLVFNKRTFSDIKAILEKNGCEVNAEIQHGFGDFQEVIFKKK